jgi:hypothetical protein
VNDECKSIRKKAAVAYFGTISNEETCRFSGKSSVVGTIYLFPFWLPLEHGISMKLFRFTSVSYPRTVGRTPWTSDQLIARPLPTKDNTVGMIAKTIISDGAWIAQSL